MSVSDRDIRALGIPDLTFNRSTGTGARTQPGDPLFRLAPEIAHSILASIRDHRALATLCSVSKPWSAVASQDAHWRPLFLARWRSPRMRVARASGRHQNLLSGTYPLDSDAGGGGLPPIEHVPWKKLFEYRLALERRWTRGDPVTTEFPLPPRTHTIRLQSNYVVACSTSDYTVLKRADYRALHTFPGGATKIDSRGELVLSRTLDNTVHLRNLARGTSRLVLPRHGSVRTLDWVGPFIFTECLPEAKVWDAATGALVATLGNPAFNICNWRSNGENLFSLSRNGAIRMWNPATGKCQKVIVKGNSNPSTGRAFFHISGNYIAVEWINDDNICVWDIETGDLVATFRNAGISIHMNGSWLYTIGQFQIHIWDIVTGAKVRTFWVPQVTAEFDQVDGTAMCFCDGIRQVGTILEFGGQIAYANYF